MIALDNGVDAATLRIYQLHTIHYTSTLKETTDTLTRPVPTYHHCRLASIETQTTIRYKSPENVKQPTQNPNRITK
jgi:hypothetical protein